MRVAVLDSVPSQMALSLGILCMADLLALGRNESPLSMPGKAPPTDTGLVWLWPTCTLRLAEGCR